MKKKIIGEVKFGSVVHSNRLFKVIKRPSDKLIKRDYYFIDKRDVVVILPVKYNGKIIIEKQFRPPLNAYIYELPAGHVKSGEDLREAARRELEEETGYKASKLSLLAEIYTSPGLLKNKDHLYLAEGLSEGKAALGEDELLSIEEIDLEDAISMIKGNIIKDAKSICAILYYKMLLI